MLQRTRSQDTITTLINKDYYFQNPIPIRSNESNSTQLLTSAITHINQEYQEDEDDIEDEEQDEDTSSDFNSLYSQDTLITPQISIFNNRSLSDFRYYKEIPITSPTKLQSNINLYKSQSSIFDNSYPILTKSSKIFNILKISSFMEIENFNTQTNKKQIFCKIEFKIYSNHLTYYILKFPTLNQTIYLLNNNSNTPSVDFKIQQGHFRITGITGTSSATRSSNQNISIHLMDPSNTENLLTHNLNTDSRGKLQINNKLSNLIQCQKRKEINEIMKSSKKLLNFPIAQYIDSNDIKLRPIESSEDSKHTQSCIQHGYLKMYDHLSNEDFVSDEMLMICCILLVLREQELKKYKGDKNPVMI
ncbi:hypothetical protein KGF54_000447 [Candida jiufengensis]|uniref:uncharacterized protein n=1 Tax=Candida jiufengensis TaxID=497108 RepID=UPI002223EF03|nr:uncharacterized protein KGF54_000447 [Candida jiufengensis]KAI5956829.1 hypothetical protein KGF54_000447 [Candida jiufengensis]